MTTTADRQRTVVIGVTVLFVLIIVLVSFCSPQADNAASDVEATSPITVPFGALGNGVAMCQRNDSTQGTTQYSVVYSLEEQAPKSFIFKVEFSTRDGSALSGLAEAQNVSTARNERIPVEPSVPDGDVVGCQVTGIQQDKRVLISN